MKIETKLPSNHIAALTAFPNAICPKKRIQRLSVSHMWHYVQYTFMWHSSLFYLSDAVVFHKSFKTTFSTRSADCVFCTDHRNDPNTRKVQFSTNCIDYFGSTIHPLRQRNCNRHDKFHTAASIINKCDKFDVNSRPLQSFPPIWAQLCPNSGTFKQKIRIVSALNSQTFRRKEKADYTNTLEEADIPAHYCASILRSALQTQHWRLQRTGGMCPISESACMSKTTNLILFKIIFNIGESDKRITLNCICSASPQTLPQRTDILSPLIPQLLIIAFKHRRHYY